MKSKKLLAMVALSMSFVFSATTFAACGTPGDGPDDGGSTHTSHNWSTTYTPDGDRHYQTCDGCDEKQYSDHDYGTDGVCVCGTTKPETTVAATSVRLNKTRLTLTIGDTETLNATVSPTNATDKSVTWESDNPTVAKVEDGTVTALAAGTVAITVKTANGKTATCTVTVSEPYVTPSVAAAAENGTFDSTTLTRDDIFSTAHDITQFELVQNNENAAASDKAFTVALVHDATNLYVYIYSADNARNDDDRIGFYLVEKGSSSTTNVQTYPNKEDPYSLGKDLCDEINVGKVDGGYALKARIALSKLEIQNGKIGFGVRFVDMNNKVVYLSVDSVPDDTSKTKTEQAANLPLLEIEGEFSTDAPVDPNPGGDPDEDPDVPVGSGVALASGTFNADNLERDEIFESAYIITEAGITVVQNNENAAETDKQVTIALVHDNTNLYIYLYVSDNDRNDNDRVGIYLVQKGQSSTAYVETFPLNDGKRYNAGKEYCDELIVGSVDGGYVLKAKVALSTLEISDGEIGFGIRFVDKDNKVVYLSNDAQNNETKTTDASGLPTLELNDYTPVEPSVPTVTFDASNLDKDDIFNSAATITEIEKVQDNNNNAEEKTVTIALVRDADYLYIYIYVSDNDRNDNDRVGFYLVAKGSTSTTYVQTYPNRADPYSDGKDFCDELIVGKVDGGYALKAKVALNKLEVSEDGEIGFGIRFVDKDNGVVYLSVGAENSGTKTNNASGLPKVKPTTVE